MTMSLTPFRPFKPSGSLDCAIEGVDAQTATSTVLATQRAIPFMAPPFPFSELVREDSLLKNARPRPLCRENQPRCKHAESFGRLAHESLGSTKPGRRRS